jgi:putative PIN family toxin of toxin-antitoxin system
VRVVLDTNLLVSALISPGGVPDALYRAWREHRYVLVTSDVQLEEFRRVTRYPAVRRFIESAAAGTLYNELRKLALVLTELPVVEASRDAADNFLLATALAGEAEYLATGDKRDLLAMKRFERTRIVTARRLPKALGMDEG